MAINRRSGLVVALALVATVAGNARTASAAEPGAPVPRVRSSSPRIMEVVSEAKEQSRTFRAIMEKINASDGIVYVEYGPCPSHARSCLLHMMASTANMRLLRVHISAKCTDPDLIGLLGHELRHVTEVLSDTTVRSGPAMTLMYHRQGAWRGGMFETDAAIVAGQAVRKEASDGKRPAESREPLLQLALQPGLGELPVAHDGVDRDVEDAGRLLDAQAAEESQLDDASFTLVEF
jgi:hypothetical protein